MTTLSVPWGSSDTADRRPRGTSVVKRCREAIAVLALVRDVIRAGSRNGIGVSVCGEMAGDPLYTLLLLGLGLTVFSMNGPDVPEVKKIIRSTTMENARHVARKVMSFDSERQVMHFLREETRKFIPEAF